MENSKATSRQLWALLCITKKDYRNENLTYEEASKLIQELGQKDYKKKEFVKNLDVEFVEFFKKNTLPKVVASLKTAIGMESTVIEDTTVMKGTGENGSARSWKFRGCGCSISWFEYDKRSKKAKEIEKLFHELRFKEFYNLVEKEFPKSLIKQLADEGTPLGALYSQDYSVNSVLYSGACRFAEEMGVKNFRKVTRLD